MQNRAMLIGSVGAGKSTLTNALLGKSVPAIKTQSLLYYDWIVDTPGEYTENPMFYKSIMATSLEVTHVLYLQDATRNKIIFPPNFSSGISKLPIGVVTKSDHPDAKLVEALDMLKRTIVCGPIVVTSALTGKGLTHIRELVSLSTIDKMKAYAIKQDDGHIIFYDSLYN
ncbi:EutP/PduV family microcompartment system protein [Domibacillus aminovorans]|uniref:Ethanolamine utilization protein EutP n=1 Tax=Domibacillus aminovorans TaxID=29332 RepID=A0A177L518_9BACI|nr:EutP/PduV family microcompartment system protein [Domibacillus aminovorans]OAH60445.1 ethanolamine utilization protein EutP [Domibacillus aminovorans]